VLSLVLVSRSAVDAHCVLAGDPINAVWNPERREAVIAAFAGTGAPHAPSVARALALTAVPSAAYIYDSENPGNVDIVSVNAGPNGTVEFLVPSMRIYSIVELAN
jgi:hypothetical protein